MYLIVALTFIATGMQQDDAAKQYNAASGFFNRERFEFAAEEYEKFLTDHPKHEQVPNARFFLGESYFQLKNWKKALLSYSQIVSKHKDYQHYSYALYRSGETNIQLEDYKAAEPPLNQFLEQFKKHTLRESGFAYLGKVRNENGRYEQARTVLRQGLSEFKNGKVLDRIHFELARACENLKDVQSASNSYRAVAVISTSPLADDAQLSLGVLQFEQNQFDQAIQTFSQFESRFGTSLLLSTVHLNKALSYYQLTKYSEAITILKRMSQAAEPSAESWYWLGMTQQANQQLAESVATLDQAAARFPDSPLRPDMLFQAAMSRYQSDEFAAAEQKLVEFVKRHPSDENADDGQYYAIESALRSNEAERSIKLSDDFLRQYSRSPLRNRVLLARSEALIQLERFPEAIQLLTLVTRDTSDLEAVESARYFLALAQYESGSLRSAISSLEKLLSTESSITPEAEYLSGVCHFDLKELDQAAALFSKYLARGFETENVGTALAYLSICQSALGKTADLKTTLDQLRKQGDATVVKPAMLRTAQSLFQSEEFQLAGQLFVEVASGGEDNPWRSRAQHGAGWSLFKLDDFKAARPFFAGVVQSDPNHELAPEAGFMKGQCEEASGQLADARTTYQMVASKYGKSEYAFDARLQIARILQREQKADQAAQVFKGITEDFRDSKRLDQVYFEWAWVRQNSGAFEEADAIMETMLQRYADSPLVIEATLMLCGSWAKQGKYQKIIERATPLTNRTLEPRYQEAAWYHLGSAHSKLQHWAETRSAFQNLIAAIPTSSLVREANFWIAEADRNTGKSADTIARLSELVGSDGSESWVPLAWLRLAQAHGEKQNWKEVLTTTMVIEHRFPKFESLNQVRYHKGRALQSLGKLNDARETFRKAMAGRTDETAAKSQFMIGETWFHQKEYRNAIREFLKVEILYAFPKWQAASLMEAAKCHELMDQWSRAVESYRRVLDKYKSTEYAAEARTRLAAAEKKL